MQRSCPYCGGEIFSENANFCSDCGRQLRVLSPEDAALVPPEDQRHIPMPVIEKKISGVRSILFTKGKNPPKE